MSVLKIIEVPLALELPVGPQHPALHEPVLLRAYADGEEIIKVEINTGYNHRGIEKLCEKNSFYRDIFIVTRVCGICNQVHANCYVRAVEHILGMEISNRAKYLRVLAMELERLHSHMLISAVMAENIGFENLFMNIMLDRERIMKAKEILTGNRVLSDYMMVGGVRRDVDDVKKEKIKDLLLKTEERIKYYRRVFEEDPTIIKRLVDVGTVSTSNAVKYSLVGPVARASGVRIDSRASDKYDAYSEIPFNVITRSEGDSWARMMVRWDETLESINMALYVLNHLPSDANPVPDEKKLPRKIPAGEAYTRVEAQRGELTYYVMSDGKSSNPYRVKIRTPSFNNIISSGFMYVGHTIADLPVILTSLDPCVSCMERVTVIDLDKNVSYKLFFKDLAKGV
ncbi:MAG: nickel-dependent hydrogenase large subunit [Thermosphaera aggregans]|jgi:Ni,Fe-hydrogenase III large subunit|uniref:hydrogenase large subunit n=1 Tax=Thermosphaera aggregans TaxID=54254 RepID=UPI003C06E7C9